MASQIHDCEPYDTQECGLVIALVLQQAYV